MVQLVAWHQTNDKPLTKPMLIYCQEGPRNKLQWHFDYNAKNIIQENTPEIALCKKPNISLRPQLTEAEGRKYASVH